MTCIMDHLDKLEASTCPAETIVSRIIRDIRQRKGVGDEFDMMDDSIAVEMLEGWVADAKDVMSL